jgi:hypothetical protein
MVIGGVCLLVLNLLGAKPSLAGPSAPPAKIGDFIDLNQG